jgi:Lon protease-like protein
MLELPLFPLNTVLFPGMPIKLHIFEERYKQMMQLCLDEDRPFGVVLIREGREALGPLAEPHMIGCTARVIQVEPLERGNMNILAIGQERFEIVSLARDLPYLVGEVSLVPLDDPDLDAVAKLGSHLSKWLMRYLETLSNADLIEFDPERLPEDPMELAYMAAALLQVQNDQKQSLLAAERATALLAEVCALYKREVALLDAMLDRPAAKQENGPLHFSLN